MSILKRTTPPSTAPERREAERQHEPKEQRLRITVVFTTTNATLAALRRAEELADQLGAEIRVVATQISPYPLPLQKPPVDRKHLEQRFRELLSHAAEYTLVEIAYCRDEETGLTQLLPPHSLVVIGGRLPWWPTKARRLARKLSRAGHHVVFVA